MIDGSEKRNRQLAFELQNSHVCEKRSNITDLYIVSILSSSNQLKKLINYNSIKKIVNDPCRALFEKYVLKYYSYHTIDSNNVILPTWSISNLKLSTHA